MQYTCFSIVKTYYFRWYI